MSVETAQRTSVWIGTAPDQPSRPQLEDNEQADVAVVGGGIVGITTALMLGEAGLRVVLLEGNQLARGVSGYTTAKVSSQHGMMYATLRSKFGSDGARIYGQSNEGALRWMERRVEEHGIDCDWRGQPSYAYVSSSSQRSQVEDEVEAAVEAGLPATLVESTPLPYPVEAAVRFEDQAEFHARKYLLALADQAEAAGVRIYENSHAVEVDTDENCLVKTPGGRVTADQVVVATHYPFLDRSLAFARVHPYRSYAIVCRVKGAPPPGMYISGESPTRSIRAVPVDGEDLLLVGGESHKVGTGGDTEQYYAELEQFAREHWDVEAVDYRWSSQDGTTIDEVPYIGTLNPREERIFMATGFKKWGMTGGTVAAMIFTDLLQGRSNPWAELYDPNRFKPLASATKLVHENAQAGVRMVGDRLTKPGRRSIEDLEPGEGDIVRHDGEKVAGYRYEDGSLIAVSARCTHLGCQVNWNRAESSWDCPCHGSRFSPEGDVLEGPAVHRLERKPIAD